MRIQQNFKAVKLPRIQETNKIRKLSYLEKRFDSYSSRAHERKQTEVDTPIYHMTKGITLRIFISLTVVSSHQLLI